MRRQLTRNVGNRLRPKWVSLVRILPGTHHPSAQRQPRPRPARQLFPDNCRQCAGPVSASADGADSPTLCRFMYTSESCSNGSVARVSQLPRSMASNRSAGTSAPRLTTSLSQSSPQEVKHCRVDATQYARSWRALPMSCSPVAPTSRAVRPRSSRQFRVGVDAPVVGAIGEYRHPHKASATPSELVQE